MLEPRTPIPWTPRIILHLAVVEDVDFAVLAANQHAKLVKRLAPLAVLAEGMDDMPSTLRLALTLEDARYAREVIREIEKDS